MDTPKILNLLMIGSLSVMAFSHLLMYFKIRRRPAHIAGFVADVCMIMLLSFTGRFAVWGDYAVSHWDMHFIRGMSFFFLVTLFGSLSYMHALRAKLRRIKKIYAIIPPIFFLALAILFFIVDPAYFKVLRYIFYLSNFMLMGYVFYQLILSQMRGDGNGVFLLVSFFMLSVFFTFAVCYDFRDHDQTYKDYIALFFIMVSLDVNLIMNSGFQADKYRTEKWSAPLNKQIEDLQTSNQTKDRFLSIIAHDLKNPISSIKMLSDIYLEEARAENSTHKIDLAESLSISIDNLYKLLENLLTWTRTQNDTIKCVPQMIDVESLVGHLKCAVDPICSSKNIAMKVSIRGGHTIYADPNMMQTILRNLVTNALKYSYPDNFIEVVFDSDDTSYTISVSDNGTGIPPEIKERLFKIDQISSTTGTQMETGTGLGLVLCREFVQKHHGDIKVASEQGLGSTFTVVLPKTQA